jgi:hypothetical protein
VGIGTRLFAAKRTFMLVPEAAMHQQHLSLRWKNEIGRSGQITPMKPVTVSKTMRKPAYK